MILVGDVGGTRTRLALAARDAECWRLAALEEFPTSADTAALVAGYLKRHAGTSVSSAAFCGAGPVASDGSIQLTNARALLKSAELAEAAGVPRAVLINDFGAVAESIPRLPPESLVHCGGGKPVISAPIVVLGPGTGLGVALAAPDARGWRVIVGEGGHADLAPVDDDELEIWQRLRAAHGRVSSETVLCGPGLERLYAVVAGGARRGAEDIAPAARAGDVGAARTVTVFTRWLGRVAGNLALMAGARGGVYIAGGIIPRWLPDFDAGIFRRAFEEKPPHAAWLREIPSFVVTHPQPALIGLAALAETPA